ncbi:MAG: biotin transporter BioY [Clostridia bacterium]|nr:biotin transporter BioY [Clostridia bacterium]
MIGSENEKYNSEEQNFQNDLSLADSEVEVNYENDKQHDTIEKAIDRQNDLIDKAIALHDKRRRYIMGIATSGIFIAFMVVSAFINIPIGTIKITMQFLVANVCALLLGKKWGTVSLVLYLALGLMGLPIFSSGGGPAYVLQPSFGYIIGFAIGGFFAAWYREKVGKHTFKTYMIASLINMLIMDVFGTVYGAVIMYGYMHSTMGVWAFFWAFLVPFIPIDIIKCIVGSLICAKIGPMAERSLRPNRSAVNKNAN